MASKVRKGKIFTGDAEECEHPDGGTFGIIPMGNDAVDEYAKVVTKEEFMRDPNTGRVLFTPGKLKRPVMRHSITISDLVLYAVTRLRYVRDFEIENVYVNILRVTEPTEREPWGRWAFVGEDGSQSKEAVLFGRKAFTPEEMLEHLLRMPAEALIPRFVWYDANNAVVPDDDPDFDSKAVRKERVLKQDSEGYHTWVVRTSAEKAEELHGVVRGNSSTTPSTSSDRSSVVTTMVVVTE